MQDLSLHLLDVAENSISAGASLVEITLFEEPEKDLLVLTINDNGRGMDNELLSMVDDPFATTRTTRRVGLGIPMLKQATREADGSFEIKSVKGEGTRVVAKFKNSHIDRKPLGDIGSTIVSLVVGNPEVDFIYKSNIEGNEVEFDTREIKEVLDIDSLSHPSVIKVIRELFT